MDLEKYRQVISDAIEGEIAAQKFYKQVADRIRDEYLKELFGTFAREEAKHEKILSDIMTAGKMDAAYFDFEKDFRVAETIDMPRVDADMNLKDAVGIAMKNEEIAMKKYMALAENCGDETLKSVFLDLAAMERKHKFDLEKSFVDVAYPEIW